MVAETVQSEALTLPEVLTTLRRHERELRRQGVTAAAVFGSVARGEARPGSDVDVVVKIDPGANFSLLDHAGLRIFLSDLLGCPVDVVVDGNSVRPRLRKRLSSEAVPAF